MFGPHFSLHFLILLLMVSSWLLSAGWRYSFTWHLVALQMWCGYSRCNFKMSVKVFATSSDGAGSLLPSLVSEQHHAAAAWVCSADTEESWCWFFFFFFGVCCLLVGCVHELSSGLGSATRSQSGQQRGWRRCGVKWLPGSLSKPLSRLGQPGGFLVSGFVLPPRTSCSRDSRSENPAGREKSKTSCASVSF